MKILGSVGRMIAVAAVIVVTGFLGLAQMFSDLGPHETEMQRLLLTVLTFIIGSMLIGLIVPKRWYLAVLNAWGPLLLAAGGLFIRIRMGRITQEWAVLVQPLIIIPGLTLLSARAAALIRQRILRRASS